MFCKKATEFTTILIRALLLITTFTYNVVTRAQNNPIANIDSLLEDKTGKDLFSGVVLVADTTGILLSKGYGYTDREHKLKNTPNTRFYMGKTSYALTGTAITLLAQQGKLQFTDTIGKYIKGLPKGDVITIHQMLTYSSGFDFFEHAKGITFSKINSCKDAIPFMRTMPLLFTPGESTMMTTGNLILLGAVIEQLSGMRYPDYFNKTFVLPLGLTNTTFTKINSPVTASAPYAQFYGKSDHGLVFKVHYGETFTPLSAGGAWTSSIDLYKFYKAVFSNTILDTSSVKQMTKGYTSGNQYDGSFGYTWYKTRGFTKTFDVCSRIGSSSYNFINEYYPAQKYIVIVLSACDFVNTRTIQHEIENILFSKSK